MKVMNNIEEKILLDDEEKRIKLYHNITTDTYILYKNDKDSTIIFDNDFNQIILSCVVEFVYEEDGRLSNYKGYISDIFEDFFHINECNKSYFYKNIHIIKIVEIERKTPWFLQQ